MISSFNFRLTNNNRLCTLKKGNDIELNIFPEPKIIYETNKFSSAKAVKL